MSEIKVEWVQGSSLVDWNMDMLLAPGQGPLMVPVVRVEAVKAWLNAQYQYAGKADEHIPDDKEAAYTLGYEECLADLLARLPKE